MYIYIYIYIYISHIYIYTYIYIYTHTDTTGQSGHRVSRPRGTGSVGDSVGEGTQEILQQVFIFYCVSLSTGRTLFP